jgi:hypothetical protein
MTTDEKLDSLMVDMAEVKSDVKGHGLLLGQHMDSCKAIYATKVELGQAQAKPLVWLVTASLTAGVIAYGKAIGSFLISIFTEK